MRQTLFIALGAVLFLLLQVLAGCIRADLRWQSQDSMKKDTLLFCTMPPYTEGGYNIVAFEVNGTPYLFPKGGEGVSFHITPERWKCLWNKKQHLFIVQTDRGDDKCNPHCLRMRLALPVEGCLKKGDVLKGELHIDYFQNMEIPVTITRYDPKRNLLCGRFSGILRHYLIPSHTLPLEKGFFDLICDEE